MAKVQKVYTQEFKEEAVRLVQTSGKPITQIARKLGISDRKRVARLMRKAGLYAKRKRRRVLTTRLISSIRHLQ